MSQDLQLYVPLSAFLEEELWPTDVFGSLQGTFLDKIAYEGGSWTTDDEAQTRSGDLLLRVVEEAVFELPFGFAVVFGGGAFVVSFEQTAEGFLLSVVGDLISLRLSRSVFIPALAQSDGSFIPDPDPKHFVSVHVPVGVTVDDHGQFSIGVSNDETEYHFSLFDTDEDTNPDDVVPDEDNGDSTPFAPRFEPKRFYIGTTGISVEIDNIAIRMSEDDPLPGAALTAGLDNSFRGIYIGSTSIFLPPDLASALPEAIVVENAFIGTGGFSGTVELKKTVTGSLAGVEFTAKELDIVIVQSSLKKFELKGSMRLPLATNVVDVVVGVDLNGRISVQLSQQGGLITLQKQGVFKVEVDKIGFDLQSGVLTAHMAGTLTPLYQPPSGNLKWPGVRVDDISIDSQGHFHISGGWIDLPKQLSLDLYGFVLEITKIGFGKADDGRNWIGFSGGLRLVDGIPAGASVEGLRILFDDAGNDVELTLKGVGVDLEIPKTMKLSGKVALDGKEFSGAVRVDLPTVNVQLEGQFVAGTLDTGEKTFAIFLQAQLPTGIPLGPTGLGIYGFSGLFGYNREPKKAPDQGWYRNPDFSDGWFTTAPAGVAQLTKWRGAPGHLGLGAGIVLGTMSDNGYAFNGRLLLVLVFPGPVILLEGMANLFKQRAALGAEEPNFHALVVIEPGKSFLAGLDARYKYKSKGDLFDIKGSAEAFFDFQDADNWHIYLGIRDPKERRIRARIFDLFDVNGFFMLNASQLDIGSGWSYSKTFGFGKLGVAFAASMDQEATISWHPNHFTGSVAVAGKAELRAYGFSTGLSVGAKVKGDVFDPFALKGDFKVGINLPWPLPDISKTVTLEWKRTFASPPALPVPAREASIEHIKSGNSWQLVRGKSLLADDGPGGSLAFERPGNQAPGTFPQLTPPFSAAQGVPRIPADAKVALTFTRPIADGSFMAINRNPNVQPETIGDPRPGRGGVFTAGYSLQSIALQKWAPVAESVGSGGFTWVKILEGGNLPAGTPRLEAAWMPGTESPDTGHSEQQKLLINSLTPFDYISERSQAWEEWFVRTHPGYPCPLAIDALSARFDQPIGSLLDSPFTFPAPAPPFTLNFPANYGGQILENDQVIDTVLGPLDRGLANGTSIAVRPPTGVERVILRVGTAKTLSDQKSSFANFETDTVDNPFVWNVTYQGFTGFGNVIVPRQSNKIVSLFGGSNGLELGDRIDIPFSVPPAMVEVEVDIVAVFGSPRIEVFTVRPNGTQSAHQILSVGRAVARFHGSTRAPIAKVVVRRSGPSTAFAAIRRVSVRNPATAFVSQIGGPGQTFEEADGRFDINLPGLDEIHVTPSANFVFLEAAIPESDSVIRDTISALSRLSAEDPLFEPENDYRLVVTTSRADQTPAGSPYAGIVNHTNSFVHHGYFHVVGPPGIGTPDQPPGNAQAGQTGLGDLRLYIEQTVPPTIPATGDKLLIPRAFYRGYDVAVKFNEPYGELFYLKARRDLSVRLFDNSDQPVRAPDGRIAIPTPSWERSRKQSEQQSKKLWVGMVNQATCHPTDLPPFSVSNIVRDQVVSAPREDILLAPETMHQARLVPALLHETFLDPIPNLIADGGTHRLERWAATNATAAASRWVVDFEALSGPPGSGTSKVFFVKETTTGGTSSLVYQGPLGAAAGEDQPANWSDVRVSAVLRWSGGIVGLDLLRGSDRIRVTLDRALGRRSLRAIVAGSDQELAHDDITFPDPATDILVTVECTGQRVQVFFDGAAEATFDAATAPLGKGAVGLYVEGASNPRFTEIRVDDLRAQPTSAFAFDFVTSKFAYFHHHLHSFNDRIADGAPGTPLTFFDLNDQNLHAVGLAGLGGSGSIDGLGAVTEAEQRAFETLEAKAFGSAALQTPDQIEIVRVSAADATAFLVRSPDPLLWTRTILEIGTTEQDVPLAIPANLKLTEVTFGSTPASESVTLLVRTGATLAGHRIDWRPLATPANPTPAWQTYFEFPADERALADGTQVKVLAVAPSNAPARQPGTTQRFVAKDPTAQTVHFIAPGVELRVVTPEEAVLHQRRFFSTPGVRFDFRVLRKADGTAFFLFKNPDSTGLPPQAMQLQWIFKGGVGDEDLRLRRGGSEVPELATLEFALPPQS